MKIGKTKLSQKILIVICAMFMLFNFISPTIVKADNDEEGGVLAEPIMDFVSFLGDTIMNIMQKIFLGNSNAVYKNASDTVNKQILFVTKYKWIYLPNYLITPEKIFSGNIPAFDINFFNPSDSYTEKIEGGTSENIVALQNYINMFTRKEQGVGLERYWYSYDKSKVDQVLTSIVDKSLKNMLGADSELDVIINTALEKIKSYKDSVNYVLGVPTTLSLGMTDAIDVMHCSQEILDYIDEHDLYGSSTEIRESSAAILQSTVSYWYNVLRNIAIIGLLSVLVYIGIRIVTSSAATDKSKYKEMLKDWVVAICLLFFMHYFMNFIVTVTGSISSALSGNTSNNSSTTIQSDTGIEYAGDKLMGDIRLRAQIEEINGKTVPVGSRMAYSIIYAVLACYTVIFALMYLKRVIYMAFFTIMAPMVALTYPLDKIRDGKAQAFDMWMKEYIFNVLIQPFHLIIYYVLVGSTMSLAVSNPLFALVAIGFMMPAEKLLRKFFGFNKSETSGMLGGMLSGAMVMQGMNALTKRFGHAGGKGKAGGDGKPEKQPNKQVRTANSGNNTNSLMEAIVGENAGSDNNIATGNNAGGNSNRRRSSSQEDPDNPGYDMNGNLIGFGNSYDENGNEVFGKQDRMDELEGKLNEWEDTNRMSAYAGPEDIRAMQEEYEDLARERAMFEQENQEDEETTPEQTQGVGEESGEETQEREKFWNEDRKRFVGALASTGLRYTAKLGLGAGKLVARAATAGAMGTVGVVAGLASEDYSNVLKWGAAGAAGGNMLAGAAINKARRLPSDAYRVKSTLEAERERFVQEAYSKQRRKEDANKRADKEFMRDRVAVARYKDEFKDKWQEAMKAAIAYREYGVTDNDTIIKAMKLKTKGLGELADKKRILAAKTASQLNRKDVDSFGDRLRTNRFRASDVETMKQAIRDFNDWE